MPTKSLDRAANGRFLKGHPGGPGRPRRAVEQEYLATLNAVVTLDAWQEIVDRAVHDAKNGDAKARDWIARYVMGSELSSLVQLAADERSGLTADVAVESLAFRQQNLVSLTRFQLALAKISSNGTVPGAGGSELTD